MPNTLPIEIGVMDLNEFRAVMRAVARVVGHAEQAISDTYYSDQAAPSYGTILALDQAITDVRRLVNLDQFDAESA